MGEFFLIGTLYLLAGGSGDPSVTWFHMPFQDCRWLWKTIGALGLATFTARFIVQWIYSEYHKESRVPLAFWWLSLIGSLLCLAYALRQQDSIFILGYVFNVAPYSRNLVLIYRKRRREAVAALAGAQTETSRA